MSENYPITLDDLGRRSAQISKNIRVAIQVLTATDSRRTEHDIHAFAVVDITTDLGVVRNRDVNIHWSRTNNRYFVRWPQRKTGKMRDGRPERLDVVGPRDVGARRVFEQAILELFERIRKLGEVPQQNVA